MSENSKAPKVDSTLSKGLAILENLAASQQSKGVTELSRELELTKSNTFRLLQTLTTLGYVKHLDDKSYAATLKTWQVGRSSVENLNLRAVAAPEMAHLSQETGEAIYLAVPEGLTVVYIDKIDSLKPIRSWNPVGGSAPIHCVGTGKAIMASNFEQMRDKLTGKLARYTDNTLTTFNELQQDVAETLKQGYAFDRGEFRDRILSFGASILLPDGEAVAALGISLPDINLVDGGEDQLGTLVRHAAAGVSQKLRRL
ncbi:IclR family transcriptional regulator [Ruegeria sp. 2205SS24-7]|uniref:IclR family transcriptional regulator n=1 Tax=Ruegeria discodermiae TaxID=3064389 RepID=UPI00274127C6|nr:IclR family transcriptional regulator [Ruegeria sp. 2205SS24-7]MDP5217282.1 IclR family transcriptional regulator [Ruegeria sp. 2205SS24-7]